MTSTRRSLAADPRTRLSRLPAPQHWLLVSLIGTVAILALGFAVKLTPGVLPAELALDEGLTDIQQPFLNAVGIGLSTIFSPAGAVVLLALSFLFLLFVRRAPVNAFAFTGLAAFCWLSSELFKLVVAEPRPNGALLDHPLLAEIGHDSFPSGHTTFIASYAIACWVLARRARWEVPTIVGGVAAVLIMGAARLYVSGHYLTDVIGSVLVAATAAVFFAGVWNLIGMPILRWLPVIDRLGPIPGRQSARAVTA
ncbi:phosphatase PAP2 family protein [Microbacterium sp. ASV49]|uniref:Phosphatase PAP2 family protein n=1 Tax=Microbacterium candidum TaxID=3041922 RepID=A0ABT7MVJ7_9MICO|nr:phosphatase PAP2 family protein [Microbacterium sp. ASV49]MDL9978453.1 phosphatase PAP2 family protein [Microbacterium sp. ASV49]